MDKLLDYLKEVETDQVHYNEGEKDITLPYGIYTYDHPNTDLGMLIQGYALRLNIIKDSRDYTQADIDAINIIVEQNQDQARALATVFYKEFLKNAHLELFPPECQVAMHSMYTNSPKKAWMVVQESIIEFNNIYEFEKYLPLKELSGIDGSFGDKTKDSLIFIKEILKLEGYHFERAMLSNMKSLYIKLWKDEQVKFEAGKVTFNKYTRYLNGWDNRMSKLEMLR